MYTGARGLTPTPFEAWRGRWSFRRSYHFQPTPRPGRLMHAPADRMYGYATLHPPQTPLPQRAKVYARHTLMRFVMFVCFTAFEQSKGHLVDTALPTLLHYSDKSLAVQFSRGTIWNDTYVQVLTRRIGISRFLAESRRQLWVAPACIGVGCGATPIA